MPAQRLRRALSMFLRLAVALVLLGVVALVGVNLFLNLGLERMINQRPERVQVTWGQAVMVVPGRVHVRDLQIRGQGRADQWLITAAGASGRIQLSALAEQTFHAEHLRGHGVSVRYRRRVDAPVEPDPAADGVPPTLIEAPPTDPPIAGLSNPPEPDPEALYPVPGPRWIVRLDDIQVDELDELWFGPYRVTGAMRAAADLSIVDPTVDVTGRALLEGVEVEVGGVPLARNIVGEADVVIDRLHRRARLAEALAALDIDTQLTAEVEDLRFLDYYLQATPWLTVSGVGQVELAARLHDGQLQPGSTMTAALPDLVARIRSNEITGGGRARGEVVVDEDGAALGRLAVDFDDFAVTQDADEVPLVRGAGFHVELESGNLAIGEPLSDLRVMVDLPRSVVPDVTLYNRFLPAETGMSLRGGTAQAHGQLRSEGLDGRTTGDLFISSEHVDARLDDLTITGALDLHGRLADARLDEGRYDLSGSELRLRGVGVVDEARRDKDDGDRSWYADLRVVSGTVQVGAPVYLDTSLELTCRDSAPFIAAFAQKKDLPRWIHGLLSVKDIDGQARLRLGQSTMSFAPLEVRGGDHYQVDVEYERAGSSSAGVLFARAGLLSVGVELGAGGSKVRLLGARRWFDDRRKAMR